MKQRMGKTTRPGGLPFSASLGCFWFLALDRAGCFVSVSMLTRTKLASRAMRVLGAETGSFIDAHNRSQVHLARLRGGVLPEGRY